MFWKNKDVEKLEEIVEEKKVKPVTKKKTVKKVGLKGNLFSQKKNEEFIELAKELKEIIITLSERMSEIESINGKIKKRLGL